MSSRLKTLKDFKLKNKLVLLRADINSNVLGKKIIPSERIRKAATTVNYIKKQKAKVVIIAHQGNPGKKDFISLEQHAKFLNRFTKVKFVDDVCGSKALNAINKINPGEAVLLENIRFVEDEFHPMKKGNVLLKNLAPLFDFYVNDAFSVSHRDHTSLTGFPKKIPGCIGFLVEKELNVLKKILMKDCLYILGGAKPSANIKLLNGNKVLACGLFGQFCLVAKGKDLGYQNKFLKDAILSQGHYKKLEFELRNKLKNVMTPVDFAVRKDKKRKEFSLEDFPVDYEIEDIGEHTIKNYTDEIKKAGAVYMKGSAGFSEEKKFSKGTVAILKAISSSKCFSLIGGGSLSDVMKKYKLSKKKFNHVSLSGGALANYLAGEKLPGLEVLGYYRG